MDEKSWILNLLAEQGINTDDLLRPVLNDVCQKTESMNQFGVLLVQHDVLKRHQLDECIAKSTPYKQKYSLYTMLINVDAGPQMIEALDESGNRHILKIIARAHNYAPPPPPSHPPITPTTPLVHPEPQDGAIFQPAPQQAAPQPQQSAAKTPPSPLVEFEPKMESLLAQKNESIFESELQQESETNMTTPPSTPTYRPPTPSSSPPPETTETEVGETDSEQNLNNPPHTDQINVQLTNLTLRPSSTNSKSPESKERDLKYKDKFTFIKDIGKGQYGRVIKVKSNSTGDFYAIKMIELIGSSETNHDKRILKEVQILESLNKIGDEDPKKKYVTKIVGCWQELAEKDETDGQLKFNYGVYDFPTIETPKLRGLFFIQMEFCDGGNLQDWIEDDGHTMDLKQGTKWLTQVVAGVTFLHGLKIPIMHRDLKPLNILLKITQATPSPGAADGSTVVMSRIAKIGDFGASRFRRPGANSILTRRVGTDFYMSTEQRRGKTPYDATTDIYSLGVIMLMLHKPWEYPSTGQVSRVQALENYTESFCNEAFDAPHQIPPQMAAKYKEEAAMMKQMLSKESAQRPTAQQLFDWCERHFGKL